MTKWQAIIRKIEETMSVEQTEDWAKNDYALLKVLNKNISQKLKELVSENYQIAQNLKDVHWLKYKNMPKQEIQAFIQQDIERNGAGSKYLFDIRILIDYFIKGKQPAQERTKNAFCLYAFGVLYDMYGIPESLLQNSQELPTLKQYHHTHWWVYFFDEKTKRLGRSVLSIENSHSLKLSNLMGNFPTHYVGKLRLDKHLQHLHFDLVPASLTEQHLYIFVSVGMGGGYPLALGVYTHLLKDGTMLAGAILLQQVFEAEAIASMKPELIPFDKYEEYQVPKAIIMYFTEKNSKTLKVTNAIHSLEELEAFLEFGLS